jgi:hypothetical protein
LAIAGPGTTAASGIVPGEVEKLAVEFVPLLPGSEQFKLQHRRAIAACGELSAECALRQHSGMLDIGQEPSSNCAPTPTAPSIIDITRVETVIHLRIDVMTILTAFP